jgi:hypothetical protein
MFKAYRHVPALLLTVGIALGSPACAAQIYGGRAATYGRETDRRAYDTGFRAGVDAGQDDARRGRDFSYQRHDEYRDADQGYRRDEEDRYRRSYREGFQAGYTEAFSRNARYSRDGANRPAAERGEHLSVAARIGYEDGFDAGRNDARDRARFDPVRARRYREGDHDYDRRYGSRDDYKRDYRAAFEQGYREGYGRVR